MDPQTRSPLDIDEMADTLRRLNTGSSRSTNMSSRRDSEASSIQDRQARRRAPSSANRNANLFPPQSPSYTHSQARTNSALGHYASNDTFGAPWSPAESYDDDDDDEAILSYYDPPRDTQTRPVSRGVASQRKNSHASQRRPSQYSLYPPANPTPTKPLPPLPPLPGLSSLSSIARNSRRASSQGSFDGSIDSSVETSRFSQSSRATSHLDRVSSSTSPTAPSPPHLPPPPVPGEHPPRSRPQHDALSVQLRPWKSLASDDKLSKAQKDQTVYFFDISTTSATLASKHGNNLIKVWSVGDGTIQNAIKISCYTTAQARSREYFVRSHAIISEPSTLIAIATSFGDTLEIWDWAKKKKLQTIDHADRWAAVRSNVYESAYSPLVSYRGDNDTIDLYTATHSKKPFKKTRTIELRKAGLPLLPKYPELAFSATGPLLITASGPRPPRLGHPPPERETLLVAWEIHADDGVASNTPYKFVTPWQHSELDTALPSGLATYGSVAVSIWIPAGYRAIPVPAARGGQGFNLAPVAVPYRYVLVWDFSASSTRTFRIPNAISCISPDCRFIVYCDSRGTDVGARGSLVLLDAMNGKRLWVWPDPDAGAMQSGPQAGFELLDNLSHITELAFSADGQFLFVGTGEGDIGIYEVREAGLGDKMQVRPVGGI